MTSMERFYEGVAKALGWLFFIGTPIAAMLSIWLYDWRWVATVLVIELAMLFIGVGAKLCINDEKTAL